MMQQLQLPNRYNLSMENIKHYTVLIIGRSGAGKSALTKLLTNNPQIKVANSLHQVTTEVQSHMGTSFQVAGQEVRFQVLDVPGLDKADNRIVIRQKILQLLQRQNTTLNAIIYVASLTQRDTSDQPRLFRFLQQLPWPPQHKKSALIPILTKYDNLLLDATQTQISTTKQQFRKVFQKAGYGNVWGRRIYWINHTKSLQFKIKTYEQIRGIWQKQVERLVDVMNKIKSGLNAGSIRQFIEIQDKYLLKQLFQKIRLDRISYKKQPKQHSILLKANVQPQSIQQSFTAVSASSIGLFISKVCQKQLPLGLSAIMMGVPIAVALLKLVADSVNLKQTQTGQNSSGEKMVKSYEHICMEINRQMENQWRQFNQGIQFKIGGKYLSCQVHKKVYKFFDLSKIQFSCQGSVFSITNQQQYSLHSLQLPLFSQQLQWNAEIVISYELKRFDQEDLLKSIQGLRKEFCDKM